MSSGIFFFLVLIFGVVRGVQGQKMVQNDKKLCLWRSISQQPYHFFKILIFRVVGRVKGQKMVQNDKIFCPSCSLFWEPYITWLSFMVHLFKIIISPGSFFISSKFRFLGLLSRDWSKQFWCPVCNRNNPVFLLSFQTQSS